MFSFLFDAFGFENLLLISIFFIFVMIFKLGLSRSRFFSPGIANILSFIASVLVTAGVYFSGLDVPEFLYGIGIGEDILTWLVPLIILLGILFVMLKFKWGLFVIGLLFILIGALGLVYENNILVIFGIFVSLIGVWLWRRRAKKASLIKRGILGGYAGAKWGTKKTWGGMKWGGTKFGDWRKQQKEINQSREEEERNRRAQEQRVRVEAEQKFKQQQREDLLARWRADKEVKRKQQEALKKVEEEQKKVRAEVSQREKQRRQALKIYNQQLKQLNTQIKNPKISDHSRRVLSQRIFDVQRRIDTLKKWKGRT